MPTDAPLIDVKPLPGPACRNCKRPTDALSRCWHCHDRPCSKCQKPTGSAFIQLCVSCGAKEVEVRDGPGEAPQAPKRWILVLENRSEVPTAVLVKRLVKYGSRYLGLACVAFPSDLPEGTRTDRLEDGADT